MGAGPVVTILYGVLVVAPVVVGLRFGRRVTVVLYALRSAAARDVDRSWSGAATQAVGDPFSGRRAASNVLLTFSLAVLAFGSFEASAPLAEETHNPRRNMPIAVIGAVVISGMIYVSLPTRS